MTLDDFAPLAGIMAREATRDHPDAYEDARQEALIAAWRVQQDRPDASPAYVRKAARRAAVDVVRGRPAFGAASHRGRADAADYADALVSDDGTFTREPADAGALSALGAVESRAALEPVCEAVAALRPEYRALVFLRFWEDRTARETGAALGWTETGVLEAWSKRIRPALREALADTYREGIAA